MSIEKENFLIIYVYY